MFTLTRTCEISQRKIQMYVKKHKKIVTLPFVHGSNKIIFYRRGRTETVKITRKGETSMGARFLFTNTIVTVVVGGWRGRRSVCACFFQHFFFFYCLLFVITVIITIVTQEARATLPQSRPRYFLYFILTVKSAFIQGVQEQVLKLDRLAILNGL